jgi:RNA polymerase sigma-70 factor (ECF subfamily)
MSGGDEDQARDATQDAFVKALDGIDRFRGQSSFYTWFYRILVNTCLDARKRKRRWSRLFSIGSRLLGRDGTEASTAEAMPDPAASADPMESLEATELRRNLYRVLERLPDRQRTAFELKIFEEMKLSEIARVMKLETGTVKSHLFRATRAVRAALADWAEG